MTGAVIGGLLGLVCALGVLLVVRAAPPMRPIRLEDRMAPYLGDAPTPSKLLARPTVSSAPFLVVRRVFGPAVGDVVSFLDRLVGGSTSVRRRLTGLGSTGSVEEFRIEQIIWGALGMLTSVLLVGAGMALRTDISYIGVLACAVVGAAAGIFGRDWYLSLQLRRREERMLAEFPVMADLLALSVIAGEAPAAALARVCRLTHGELARDLDSALASARAGVPLTRSLTELSQRTTLEPFARFLDGMVVALERGTPLADVLRAQAMDVRELGKRALLEAGGKKEISMMVPIVFLLLPVTVLFALYPGIATLTSITN